MVPGKLASILREAFRSWIRDDVPRMGAALAYYGVFSLAPILVVAIALVGMVLGEDAARGRVVTPLRGLIGRTGARAIEAAIQNASQPGSGVAATILAVGMLLFGASAVFLELQSGLDAIWGVRRPKGMLRLRDRALSFALVAGVGLVLLISMLAGAAIEVVGRWIGGGLLFFGRAFGLLTSIGVSGLLFAFVYKALPDTPVEWRDVWPGALFAGVLFSVGKAAIGLYLAHSGVASVDGAAGSLVVVLVWTYYSAQILMFGAELRRVHSLRPHKRDRERALVPLGSNPVS